MSEPDNIQRLIRLKKYETAPPDLAEDIIRDLHQRVRSEALKQQDQGSFLDRLRFAFGDAFLPRLALAAAALAVLLTVSWMMFAPRGGTTQVASGGRESAKPPVTTPDPAVVQAPNTEGLRTGKVFTVAGVHVFAQLIDADESSDPSLLGNHFNSEPHHVVVFDATGHGKLHSVTIQALSEEEEAKQKK